MLKYLIPFLSSFLLSIALIALAVYFAKKIKWRERRSPRHIHKRGVPRIGGAVMIAIFNLAILLNKDLFVTPEIYGIMAGSLILMAVGIWDDLREIYWKIQLFFQIAISVLIFITGTRIYYITNPLTGGILNMDSGLWVVVSAVLAVFWIVLIINAVNWIDGIDGLSGGVAFISVAAIFILSLKSEVNQPPVAILCSILAGAILGFLIFNFYPAKIMAGTSGSMFMGFSLAALAIISGTKIATALLVMTIPIIDLVWVIGERIRNKKSIFRADKRHLHYKLMKLGWSQRKTVLIYWAATLVISFVALNTKSMGKGIALALAFAMMIAISAIINRKIHKTHN
jgi:UDP-GlcNAc:undecaprenyl-phosphate/decaprenyl-phosphate GlcNAc-1-phosphate transferase